MRRGARRGASLRRREGRGSSKPARVELGTGVAAASRGIVDGVTDIFRCVVQQVFAIEQRGRRGVAGGGHIHVRLVLDV